MQPAPLPAELLAAAPGIAARLAAILVGLATLIARAFLRNPRYVGIINPLWKRLNRAARRFSSLVARLPNAPGPTAASSRPGRPGGAPPVALPARHGWLLAELRHEAAHFANRLDRLLAEPETAALLAHIPQAGRILRPICHMLARRYACLAPPPRQPRATPLRTQPREEARPTPAGLLHGQSPAIPPPPSRPPPPLCPRLRERWPWVPHPNAKPT